MKSKKVDCIFGAVSRAVSLIAAISGGIFLAVMTLLITVDVLGRYFLGRSTLISTEVSGYLLVAVTFIGLTWTQKRGRHIRIFLLTRRLSEKKRKYLSLAVFMVSVVFVIWLTWCTTIPVVKCYTMGIVSLSPLSTPMWIPYMLVPLGLGIFAIQLLSQIIRQEGLGGTE
ncbi:Ectoine TRAP transporter small permease protein TeaB [subsurface metagenome]